MPAAGLRAPAFNHGQSRCFQSKRWRGQDHHDAQPCRHARAQGRDPLVIDLDPQAHLSAIAAVAVEEGRKSLYGFYNEQRPLAELVRVGSTGWRAIPRISIFPRWTRSSGRGPTPSTG